jgi:hypothetical protein
MKAVDFYKLPRSIQDRFVGSVMSGFPPAPILAAKGGTKKKQFWLAITFACFFVLVIAARVGYGSLDSGLSLHSAKALPLYIGLVFGIAFGLVQAFGWLVREKALPYASGVYLFPACVIDARSDQFKVYDTKDLSTVDVQVGMIRVAFSGGATFFFPVDPANAQTVITEVNAARDRSMRAHATDDPKELVAVDPLHNPRFSSPVGPRDPYAMKTPPWGKLGIAVAGGLGVLLGIGLWALRNNGSDNRMYAIAKSEDKVSFYREYLEHGSKYKDDVSNVDLPRAELHEAIGKKTAEALIAFKAKHPNPNPAVAKEMQQAIRAAMLLELEKAKGAGTLAALMDFPKKYPEHGVEPELRAAMHAVYTRELEAYKKRAPQKDKAALALVERLFAWAEKKGPKVEVRFKRKPPSTLERADQFVLKHPSFMGVITYPSRFFDEKHAIPRETALGKQIAAALDEGFAPELFDIQMGAAVPMEAETLPDVTVPTLFISHSAEWSGHSTNSTRPRGVYVGLQFNNDATFVIPGEKPWKFSQPIFKPYAATQVLKDEDPLPGPGLAEEKVYEAMATDAFEKFGKMLLANFVPEKKKTEPKPE